MNIKFGSMSELILAAQSEGTTISRITLHQTAIDREMTEEKVLEKMHLNLCVMKESVQKVQEEGLKSSSGLSGDMAGKIKNYSGSGLSGGFMNGVIWRALAVSEINACMGRIVAAPTAGSCGILPACLLTLQEQLHLSDSEIVNGMLNASAVGLVIAKNASISGAEGGCQAECGSAAAMAASALVELRGGSPEQCGHAIATVLKSLMGLVCDPVAQWQRHELRRVPTQVRSGHRRSAGCGALRVLSGRIGKRRRLASRHLRCGVGRGDLW
ncbi:MAG: L-serine ammonia-lyase, iron-sulfur-dependent, subunit alpha [Clostridiales bacterium]|nr:L-serine ammonia-lyase, iron-sulfur-dependent, subunit alpha [Clostridiales bacterium]